MTRRETLDWAKSVVAHIFGHHEKGSKFHNVEKVHGWVARDRNGWLYFFIGNAAPEHQGTRWLPGECGDCIMLDERFFSSVKSTDTEPTPATLTIEIE